MVYKQYAWSITDCNNLGTESNHPMYYDYALSSSIGLLRYPKSTQVTISERNKARQQATLLRAQQASGMLGAAAPAPQLVPVYANSGAT